MENNHQERPDPGLDNDGDLPGGTVVMNKRKQKKKAKEIAQQKMPSTSRLKFDNDHLETKKKAVKYIKLEDAYKLLKKDEVTGKTFEEAVIADSDYFYKKIHDLILTKVRCSNQEGKEKMVYMSSGMYIQRAKKFLFGEVKRDEGLASEAEFGIFIDGHNSSQTLARFAAGWKEEELPKESADGGECSTSLTTRGERGGGSQVASRGRIELLSGRGLPVGGSNEYKGFDSTRGSKSWNNVGARGAIKRGGSR
uniref:Uncharacterized protein n=1 Tax=Meloidogyne javanica TaxID=6303 RepID=A0A915N1H4_MELJA